LRRFIAVLMMLSLLFSGCGKKTNSMQQALNFRTALLSANGCVFTADVTIEYPEKTYDFSMDCSFTDDEATVTITKPETIAGICAVFHGKTAALEFQGVSLEFGTLANGYVAPLATPWILGSAWCEDYISAAGKDGDYDRVTWLKGYNDEELTIDTWFEDNIPIYAEISYDGARVLQVKISGFVYR